MASKARAWRCYNDIDPSCHQGPGSGHERRPAHPISLASEASGHRCGLVHRMIEDHILGESVSLASLLHFVGDAVHRSEKETRCMTTIHRARPYAILKPYLITRAMPACLTAIGTDEPSRLTSSVVAAGRMVP